MHVAIIGTGFSGLSTAWHLTQLGITNITLLDSNDIGTGASGIAAGLLYKFTGLRAKPSWNFDQGYAATLRLLNVAQEFVSEPLIRFTGLIRPAAHTEQEKDFALCAKKHPEEVMLMSPQEYPNSFGNVPTHSGLFIRSAAIIECPKYLQGLWLACKKRGVKFEQRNVASLDEVKHFDRVVIAAGGATTSLPELKHLPITPVKGQLLELEWPEGISPCEYPINSLAYLLMQPNHKTCIVGATFERHFPHANPDLQLACQLILPKIQPFFPMLESKNVIICRSAIRASTDDHKPILLQFSEKCWVLTGMGSKGLLYHALYGEELARRVACHT